MTGKQRIISQFDPIIEDQNYYVILQSAKLRMKTKMGTRARCMRTNTNLELGKIIECMLDSNFQVSSINLIFAHTVGKQIMWMEEVGCSIAVFSWLTPSRMIQKE